MLVLEDGKYMKKYPFFYLFYFILFICLFVYFRCEKYIYIYIYFFFRFRCAVFHHPWFQPPPPQGQWEYRGSHSTFIESEMSLLDDLTKYSALNLSDMLIIAERIF